MMMRSRWTIALVLVLPSACTRLNPSFDGGDDEGVGDDDEAGTTIGPGTTSQATTGSDGNDDSHEGGNESSEDSSGPETTSTSAADTTIGVSATDSGSSSSSDTGDACVPFDPPFGIVAMPSFEMLFAGGCSPHETLFVSAAPESDQDTLVGMICTSMCGCEGGQITLGFDAPLPVLSGCVTLEIWFHPMSCDVAAYLIVDEVIQTAVSNVRGAELIPPFPFSVELADDPAMPCGDFGCTPPSGRYDVVVSPDSTVVPPDGDPVPFLGGDYSAFNPGSGIDEDCNEQIRWYALPAGG